jgi:rhodanese-related sulfurtransferase
MEIAALVLAIMALLTAWRAKGRAEQVSDDLSATRRELLTGQADDADASEELNTLRRQVELLAKGVTIDPLMVREKRLFANVNTDQLAKRLEGSPAAAVIDVRSDGEWASGHIEGALHIPVEQVEKRLSEVPRDGTPMYVVCAGGGRSSSAAEFLAKRGYLNVHNVEGGMNSWRGAVVRDGSAG